jgi:formamidopyrimidine-DNA glycosylase
MPELPDVEVFRKEAEKCKNSEIESFRKNDARFVKLSDNDFKNRLKGKKFNQVIRRGKYLFMIAGKETAVILHFGMTGTLRYLKSDEEEPKYTRCSFGFKNNNSLHVMSRRKLGYVDLTDKMNEWIKSKELGPDALDIEKEDFLFSLKSRKSKIKTVITDQSVLSGIGNEYADEILYQARIHPAESSNRLSDQQKNRLFDEIQKVLKTAVEKDAGVSKFPENYLLPSRSKGEDCPACGGMIKIMKISGRTTYFCPSCQKPSDK